VPKDAFVCLGCKRLSRFGEIQDRDRVPYIVCAHCDTKNKLLRLKTFLGGEPEFAVIGIRLDDDQ
jgi:hypothetical protein